MTTAIRLYRTYILSTFVPLNTIRTVSGIFTFIIAETAYKKQLRGNGFGAAFGHIRQILRRERTRRFLKAYCSRKRL